MGLEGAGITRCQGVREPQRFEYIHAARAAATESANHGISRGNFSFLYQHYYIP